MKLALVLIPVGLMAAVPALLAAQAPADPRAPIPERPTVATHAFTVAPGYFELETGFERDANPDHTRSWLGPVYLKIGLSKRAQLGVLSSAVVPPGGTLGAGDLTLGLKYRLADELPFLGALAVLPAVKFPVADAEHGTTTTDGSLLLISSHKFGDAALDVNVGYTHRSGDGTQAPTSSTLWTVSGGLPLGGNAGLAVEVFGFPGTSGPSGSRPTVALLAGPTIGIGPHAVVDVGGIVRLRGPQPDAIYAGITWNLGHF
jgi:hypothetical protein